MQPAFRLHVQEIVEFLGDLVIKFEPFIDMFNDDPVYYRPTYRPEEPTTFPYYKILLGDASYATTPIYGWAPNLQAEVLLTRASVIANPEMYNFYQNKAQLQMLLNRYPEDQFLIKRILNPVINIQYAIDAKNLTRLELVHEIITLEEYERYDLVDFLDKFLTKFDYRWYVNTFNYEDLYSRAFWAMLWNQLTYHLLARRILNIRTNQAHSYHIWEYLTSVGFGSYKEYLSRRQELFLYRNNEYLKFNVGKKIMLPILSEVFLEPIKYSLSEKMIVSHTNDREVTFDKEPEIVPRKDKQPEYQSSTDFNYFLTELSNNNLDPVDTQEHKVDVTTEFIKAPTNELMTKFIEMVRSIDGTELMLLVRFILDSAAYLVSESKINTMVSFTSPIGGDTLNFMSTTDALNLFYYVLYRKNEEYPTLLPTKYTSVSSIVQITSQEVDPIVFYGGVGHNVNSYIDIQDAIDSVPYINSVILSPIELSEQLGSQYVWIFEKIAEMKNITDSVTYLASKQVYSAIVPECKVLTIAQNFTSYAEYFEYYPDISGVLEQLTDDDQYLEFTLALFEAICPIAYGFQAIADDKDAAAVLIFKMKEVFTYLTSYNVTFFTPAVGIVDEYFIPTLTASCSFSSSNIESSSPSLGRNNFDYELTMTTVGTDTLSVDIVNMYEMGDIIGYAPITIDTESIVPISEILHSDAIYVESYGADCTISEPI